MMVPELAISKGQNFLEVQNIVLMIQGVILILLMIILVALTEKKYISIIKKQELNLITLNSLEISGLKNLKYAENFAKILTLVRPGENFLLNTSYVFDMTQYNLQKRKMAFLSQKKYGNDEQRRHSEDQPLRSSFENIRDNHFANKMIVSFSHLSVVKELINIYHSGILAEKIKSDLENGRESESYERNQTKVIQKILDNEDDINKIHIQMAQDLHDIIWENYYQINKKKRFAFIGSIYIISCALFWFISGFCEYILTKNFLTINFIDQNSAFSINLLVMDFKTNGAMIGFTIAKFVIQQLGYYMFVILLNQTNFSYFSSQSNFNFIFISIYDLIYMFPATHYGYTEAVFDMRDKLGAQNLDNKEYFSKINLQWVKISFILLFSSLMKIFFFWAKGIYLKLKQKHSERVLDNQIVTTSLVNVFMYLGFYQSLLTPLALIVCTINFLVLYLFNKQVQKNENLLKIYLSYQNITMIMQFSLFVFGIGGFLSFNVNYNFSYQYFSNLNEDLFLPYFFITCSCICIIFSPTLYLLMRHNSVSLRILNNFQSNYEIPEKQVEFMKTFDRGNYYSSNPYYQEAQQLNIEIDKSFNSQEDYLINQLVMYSLSVRFNKIFFYGMVNLAVLCFANYLTGLYLIQDKTINTDFNFINHYYFKKQTYSKSGESFDQCVSTFKLEVKNLQNIDNWNLKQLFFYLEIEWEENGKRNGVIFWDKIMPRSYLKDFSTGKVKTKYPLVDTNMNLRSKELTVNLWVEQIPVFGWIHRRKYGSWKTKMPDNYTT